MDAISSTGVLPSFRSWDPTLLKQKRVDKTNYFSAGKDASSQSQKIDIPLDTPSLRYAQATNKIFADDTATTTIGSIENFFKNGNLQDTFGIVSYRDDDDAALSMHSREEIDTNLAKGNGLSVSTTRYYCQCATW